MELSRPMNWNWRPLVAVLACLGFWAAVAVAVYVLNNL